MTRLAPLYSRRPEIPMPPSLNDEFVHRLVGPRTWNRALEYLESADVRGLSFTERGPNNWSLSGRIQAPNTTTFHVNLTRSDAYTLGYCTCSVAVNCHHVAAVAMTAIDTLDALRKPSAPPPAPAAPSWQEALAPWSTLTRVVPTRQEPPLAYRLSFDPVPGDLSRANLRVQAGKVGAQGFVPVSWNDLRAPGAAPSDKRVLLELLLPARTPASLPDLLHRQPITVDSQRLGGWLEALSEAPVLLDALDRPIRILPDVPVEPRLYYQRGSDSAMLKPIWHGVDGPIDAANSRLLGDPPSWVLLDDALHLLSSAPAAASSSLLLLDAEALRWDARNPNSCSKNARESY